jgi:FHA domain-containing protein
VAPEETVFTEAGGTIGRADGNTLVLSDPQKAISRVHARVFRADGRWMIEDRGSAVPVVVNNRPLGNGVSAPIGVGDSITIGGYALQVVSDRGAAAPMPATASTPKDDPLAMFGGGGGGDPFADLIPPLAAPPPAKPARSAPASGVLPDDFDPFGAPQPAPPDPLKAGGAALPDDFSLGIGLGSSGKSPSVDELFDLKPGAGPDPFGPGHPLGERPLGRAGGSPSVDPMVAIGAARPADTNARPAQRDDVPEIHGSFRPPEARPTPEAPPSMLLSWDEAPGAKIKTVIIPATGGGGQDPAAPRPAQTVPPRQPPQAAPQPAPQPGPSRSAAAASDEELLRAFLAGAGVPDLQVPGPLTPQLMNVFGTLLRTATQGTLDLLMARALTKREVQAAQTMILERDNNPLKFSPSVDVAMHHLLAPRGMGFMSPVRAMKDAYDDLRAHQFGVVAGTRAALEGVVARFDPAELEKRLTQRSVLGTFLPGNRKAGLWDLFVKLYAEIAKEAEEDFHALFGREFLKAYEAQIAKLESRDKPGERR